MSDIKKFNLIYICPFSGSGGTQEYTKVLAKQASKFYCKINVIMPFDNEQIHYYNELVNFNCNLTKINKHLCDTINSKNIFSQLIGSYTLSKIIKKLSQDKARYLIHSNLSPRAFYFLVLFSSKKSKHVNTFHDFGLIKRNYVRYFYNSIISLLSLRSNFHFITPSKYIKNQLLSNIVKVKSEKVSIVNTGITCLEKNYKFKKKKQIKIVTVGRLSRAKAWDIWIKVAISIVKSNDNIFFSWYGNGPDKGKLKKKIPTKYKKNIRIFGHFEKLDDVLKNQDIFLFSSRYEGGCLPRGIQEAMSYGIPCIIPSLPSIMESIGQKKLCYLYEPDNSGSLMSVINYCYLEYFYSKKITSDARRHIELFHSEDQEFKKTKLVYDNLMY